LGGDYQFPTPWHRMRVVLDHTEEALHAALTVDGLSVVVYGYTTRADTKASLEKDWKNLNDIAKDGR